MPKFKVDDHVTVKGDTRIWGVTAVNNTSDPITYDLALLSDSSTTRHNVPEGDMSIAT